MAALLVQIFARSKQYPEGFLYPVVNEENCINCGVCDATCPIHNKIDRTKEKTKGFILRVKDEKILFESTSGGDSLRLLNMC